MQYWQLDPNDEQVTPEKPETVKLVLVRHGETVENVNGVVQGQTDGTLTERGLFQAREAARSLADTPLDAACTSDLKRASDTAGIILAGRDNVTLVRDERLREQDLGVYVGGPVSNYMDAIARAGAVRERFDPEGGEPSGSMRGRVKAFLDDMAAVHAGETVLVVTHQGVIGMVADITGLDVRAGHAEPVIVEYSK